MGLETISFIVPCHNGAKHLRECIDSVLTVDLPDGFQKEVIVVDNNSTDNSAEILQTYVPKITVLQEPVQGRSQARNCGIKAAAGEILCFCDIDVVLTKNWFLDAWKDMKRWKDWSLVSTHILFKKADESWFERWRTHQAKSTTNTLLVLNNYSPCLNSASFISRKSVLEKIGYFDNGLNYFEDADLGRKVGALGRPMLACEAIAYCYSGMTIRSYLVRAFKLGLMSVNYYYRWNDLGKLQSKLGTIKFYAILCFYHFTFRYRPDYMWFKTLNNFLQLFGAIASLAFKMSTEKFPRNESNEVKIIGGGKIIKINLYNEKVKVLHLTPFKNFELRDTT